MQAIITGTMTPHKGNALAKPSLCKKAIPHTVKTKALLANWIAATTLLLKIFVKLAITKAAAPEDAETNIHRLLFTNFDLQTP